MAMVASTVLYSMSSMSGGGVELGIACEEEAWPLQPSGSSPTSPEADGKAESSERGGADMLLVLDPASFSSFTSSEGVTVTSPLLPSCSSSSPPAIACPNGSGSSPCAKPSLASCSREDEEENEEEEEEDASIFSSLGEESRCWAGVGSGEGGSCSVPGSISEEESRVSVSEVLAGVSASWWSAFGSQQGGRDEAEEEEVEATQSAADAASPALSSSLLTRRRFTGVAPSSSADTHTQSYRNTVSSEKQG